ncbi:MAG: cysteine rich repeat-containing protein [Pseudomonadota bacterium]
MDRKICSLTAQGAFSKLTLFMIYCMACFGTPAYAENNQPCADDIVKFCQNIQPGGGRIAQCLASHVKDISSACRTRIAEIKNRMVSVSESCEDDVEQLCKEVRPGGGRILNCLKDHAGEISSECKATLTEKRRNK